MIKNFTPRLYQETILATAVNKNTLVVLPTGMGKTNIFLMLAAQRLRQYPNSRILFIGPTKPLIDQYLAVFKEHFDIGEDKMAVFTGMVSPEKRAELWKTSQIIFSTPQGLENDIISSRINLEEVSLLGVDEAHRAVGDYSYCWLAKQYEKLAKYPRILALTASPGSELEKINEVIANLFIEEIEVRIDTDPDVSPYVQDVQINWVKLELPEELKVIQKYLKDCYKGKLKDIESLGYLDETQLNLENKSDLLRLQGHLQSELAQGNRDFSVMKSLSIAAEAIKVQHALELLETQGMTALSLYLEDIQTQAKTSKVKAVQNLVRDLYFRSALIKTRSLIDKEVEHPKIEKLKETVKDRIKNDDGTNKDYKLIIFSQYRDTCQKIVEELTNMNITAKLFVGQANRRQKGLTQKQQIKILEQFKDDQFNVLVSSSVGEEGLDIPQVDEVIFYEPIPSAIRQIQRKGRTGRQEKGKVTIFVTSDTRDVGYRWSAFHKEKKMYRNLKDIKKRLIFADLEKGGKKEVTLNKFIPEPEKVKLFVDHREKGNHVMKELLELGASIQLEQLEIADYQVSKNVGVEFKTQEDFIESLIDGRLFKQLKEMKDNFLKPLIIVEGTSDIYSIKNIHPNSIRGMLASIAVDFNIPILYSKTFKDTAALLIAIAKREQEKEYGRDFEVHGSRKPASFRDQQEYIVSAMPGVGPNLAKQLLEKFKSVKNIVNASEEELKQTEKIGEKKAKDIKDIDFTKIKVKKK